MLGSLIGVEPSTRHPLGNQNWLVGKVMVARSEFCFPWNIVWEWVKSEQEITWNKNRFLGSRGCFLIRCLLGEAMEWPLPFQGSLVVHGQSRCVGPGRNGPRVDGSMWPAASHGRIHEPERGKVGEREGLSCDVESSNYVLVLSLSLGSSSSFTRWTLQRVLCWCKD